MATDLAGRRVLELGCGLGLPAIAAAHAGAVVLATDWAEDALAFAARNAARNGVRVQTALLAWDRPETLASRQFDIVLGADLLYEQRNAAPLLTLLDRALAPEGFALVADPGRRHAHVFLEAARRAGWVVDSGSAADLPQGAIHRLWREQP
jgi:predicted nicotinamide N-methyase